MSAPQCIHHPKVEPLVILRASYLAMCGEDHCQAILLGVVEYWTNKRLEKMRDGKRRPRSNGPYFFATLDDLSGYTLGLYKPRSISKAIEGLIGRGYVIRQRNPVHKYDRTYQYTLNYEAVQMALDAWQAARASGVEAAANSAASVTSNSLHDANLRLPADIAAEAVPEASEEESLESTTRPQEGPGAVPEESVHKPDTPTRTDQSLKAREPEASVPQEYQELLEAVAKHIFKINPPLDAGTGARPAVIARYLQTKNATPDDVRRFVDGYHITTNGLRLPLERNKLAEAWTRWEQDGKPSKPVEGVDFIIRARQEPR